MNNSFYTDLIVIGAGAAGLMAGVSASEAGLHAVVLERKHKPGRKLLMCGNNRCNLSSNISVPRMLEMFGEPSGPFLQPAIEAFSPSDLQRWFNSNGLKTAVMMGNRVYPESQNADDVLHFFTDSLRDKNISLCLSAPVESLAKQNKGFLVKTTNFQLSSRFVIVATGGVSYPKTGSVGDGQNFARILGHTILDYRPGLVGLELKSDDFSHRIGQETINANIHILDAGKNKLVSTYGAWEFTTWGIEGSAISNATRLIARMKLKNYSLLLEYPDGHSEKLHPLRTRSIKEAMVTVGGIELKEIDNQRMESRRCPGLYFAGEVMDIDGPTGGYNLQAAFSTARLAAQSIAKALGKELPTPVPPQKNRFPGKRRKQKMRKYSGNR